MKNVYEAERLGRVVGNAFIAWERTMPETRAAERASRRFDKALNAFEAWQAAMTPLEVQAWKALAD